MSATSSNSQPAKSDAQSSTKPADENKSALPSLGALDEDDEFEEFDEQGKHLDLAIASLPATVTSSA